MGKWLTGSVVPDGIQNTPPRYAATSDIVSICMAPCSSWTGRVLLSFPSHELICIESAELDMSNRGKYRQSEEADHYHNRTKTRRLLVNGKLTFGKFKDKPLDWVIKRHPGYIEWASENVSGFKDIMPKPKPIKTPFVSRAVRPNNLPAPSCLNDALDGAPSDPSAPPW